MSIKATPIMRFPAIDRIIAMTATDGTMTLRNGSGEQVAAYTKGSVVIADGQSNSIAGPTSLAEARSLATAIMEGNQRALTHPQCLLLLAASLLLFTDTSAEAPAQATERKPNE